MPSNPTTTDIAMTEPIAPFTLLAPCSIITNINITIDSAAVAGKSFCHSINDNAATAAAITPIATAIAIIEPLQSSAPSVAAIIPDMNIAKTATAATPFASAGSDIIPSIIDTAAKIATDTLNASNVAPILTISVPLAYLLIATIARTNPANATMNNVPFPIAARLNLPTSCMVIASNNSEAEIDNIIFPKSFAFLVSIEAIAI